MDVPVVEWVTEEGASSSGGHGGSATTTAAITTTTVDDTVGLAAEVLKKVAGGRMSRDLFLNLMDFMG